MGWGSQQERQVLKKAQQQVALHPGLRQRGGWVLADRYDAQACCMVMTRMRARVGLKVLNYMQTQVAFYLALWQGSLVLLLGRCPAC
jgi:hypothetical protein